VKDICEVVYGFDNYLKIILGDNREMTKPFHDIADRVLLGLLPSSREGWPLAMQVLKQNVCLLYFL
jgi:tRNA wybutosine-synthesizing protein 2